MNKKMNKKIILSSVSVVLLVLPTIIMAQTLQGITAAVTNTITSVLSIIAGGFIIFMMVLAGFKYLTAQGDPSKVVEANRAVAWSLAGVAIIVLAWSVTIIVSNTLGL